VKLGPTSVPKTSLRLLIEVMNEQQLVGSLSWSCSPPNHDVQTQGPLAELFRAGMIVMFSPGLPQLWHEPSTAEVDVWEALDHPAAVRTLLSRGHSRETLDDLLSQGTIEYAD